MNTGIDRNEYPFDSHYVNVPAGRMHYVDEGKGALYYDSRQSNLVFFVQTSDQRIIEEFLTNIKA